MSAGATISILLLLFAYGATAARAQSTMDEQALRALDDRERIAALNRDMPALEALWSEHFTVNAPNDQVVVGRQRNLDTFVRGGIINFSSFERTIEFIRVDGDFGVVMGLETVGPRADAPSAGLVAGQVVRRRFTNIWKNEGGTWRLYWRHANVIPNARSASSTSEADEQAMRGSRTTRFPVLENPASNADSEVRFRVDAPLVQWIEVNGPGGSVMRAAVARPDGPGPFPAAIVLHGTHSFA